MKLSGKIWEELGALAQHIEMLDHDNGIASFKPSASQQDIDAVNAVIAAHDPLAPGQAELIKQADASAVAAARVDPVIQYLVTHTPAECAQAMRDFIESSSVTNLATAQACLGRIETRLAQFAKALSVICRDRLR